MKVRTTIGIEEEKLRSINLILTQVPKKNRDDLMDEAIDLLAEKYKSMGVVTELENLKGEIIEWKNKY